MPGEPETVTVVGGGFAGVEAAWAAAQRGCRVRLIEMRPVRQTAVHRTGDLAELVCSNSFKSNLLTNASGVLKEEMRRLGSLVLPIAARHAVPAGEALAVDREAFAREVTETIFNHPSVDVVRAEVTEIPDNRPLVLATGPLTSESLAQALLAATGSGALYFFDAVAPTVTYESLDLSKVFRASRRGRTSQANPNGTEPTAPEDYLNCPLNRDEYDRLRQMLAEAEEATPHHPDEKDVPFFEMCLPVEELARRGAMTLAFGPLKPIGLTDPATGRRPYAVVQLRQENREGTLWGLVGFQTRLKWGEQKRIFRTIPGLKQAEFVRYGVMHKNLYLCAPKLLEPTLELRSHAGCFIAGQISGVEGYLESAATGLLAGINAARVLRGEPPAIPPRKSVLGSLCAYLTETPADRFAPMNSNWGIVPDPAERILDKREKSRRKGEIAVEAIEAWRRELGEVEKTTS